MYTFKFNTANQLVVDGFAAETTEASLSGNANTSGFIADADLSGFVGSAEGFSGVIAAADDVVVLNGIVVGSK